MPKDQSATLPRIGRSLQRAFMQGHVSLYRWSKGKIGGGAAGRGFLILTTVGRKSGQKRATPLFYFSDANDYIVIASNGGAPKHPTWWLNLQADPKASVQIKDKILTVTATEAQGEDRERLWTIISENYKNFVQYQQRTTRPIPIIILTPDA